MGMFFYGMSLWKIWNITECRHVVGCLILLGALEFYGLRVSRNGKDYSVVVSWDKKYKNEILVLSTIFVFFYEE